MLDLLQTVASVVAALGGASAFVAAVSLYLNQQFIMRDLYGPEDDRPGIVRLVREHRQALRREGLLTRQDCRPDGGGE